MAPISDRFIVGSGIVDYRTVDGSIADGATVDTPNSRRTACPLMSLNV